MSVKAPRLSDVSNKAIAGLGKPAKKTTNGENSNSFEGNTSTQRPDTVEKLSLQWNHCLWVQGISQDPGTLEGQK